MAGSEWQLAEKSKVAEPFLRHLSLSPWAASFCGDACGVSDAVARTIICCGPAFSSDWILHFRVHGNLRASRTRNATNLANNLRIGWRHLCCGNCMAIVSAPKRLLKLESRTERNAAENQRWLESFPCPNCRKRSGRLPGLHGTRWALESNPCSRNTSFGNRLETGESWCSYASNCGYWNDGCAPAIDSR